MYIREATPDDNLELQQLQARCPQGTALVVSTVNTPDFFARARAYESFRVFVAWEEGRIVGSIACALRNALVGGKPAPVGYGFQAFVPPEQRRKGIASRLHERREAYLVEQGAGLIYSLVMESNTPSMRLLERRGFKLHRTLVMPGLGVYREMEVPSRGEIRPAVPRDLPAISRLLNETWGNSDLFEPASAGALARFVARTPAYDLEDLVILEDRGEIRAALGLWDWSRIARVTLLRLSPRVRLIGLLLDLARIFRPMPRSLRAGDVLRQGVLTPIAFRDPDDLSALLRHANNRALRPGIEQIFAVCERGHPLLGSTRGFIRVDTGLNLYVKTLKGGIALGGKPVFVDGIDL